MGKDKKPKKDKFDPVTNPVHRLVRVTKSGRARVLADRKARGGTRPFLRYNYYAKRYEFVLEFFNAATNTAYQVTADRLDWERTIADLQRAFKDVEDMEQEPLAAE